MFELDMDEVNVDLFDLLDDTVNGQQDGVLANKCTSLCKNCSFLCSQVALSSDGRKMKMKMKMKKRMAMRTRTTTIWTPALPTT